MPNFWVIEIGRNRRLEMEDGASIFGLFVRNVADETAAIGAAVARRRRGGRYVAMPAATAVQLRADEPAVSVPTLAPDTTDET